MLFDTIPLRVVPPFILGAIIYKPVGLVPSVPEFWKLILILVLFNLVASSAVFLISIIVADTGVANLLGSLVMLFKCVTQAVSRSVFVASSAARLLARKSTKRSALTSHSLLFAGLLINREKVPYGVGWIQSISVRRALDLGASYTLSSSTPRSRRSSSTKSATCNSSITSSPWLAR